MDIIAEKMMRDKSLSDDPQTILKPFAEETVGNNDLGSTVITTTVVEKTEVSVVNMVQQEAGEHNEITGNEKEGLFGNLAGEDEGLKVNCSENGASVGMDVEGSLAGENGSHIEKASVLGNEHDKNETVDPMDIFEPKEDLEKYDEENIGEQAESEDHGFVVGDFVWGKIKSHPWWPGQIYDPSDASDYAVTLKHKGQLLVAYFGDRSFSWCSPSQLKPFIDNFEQMSSQSDSKKFVYAVQNCLEEVSRRVEAELVCKCQTNVTENVGVVNRGIKEGACAPKGNTVKVLVDGIEPVELVSALKGYATMEPGARRVDLELVVLKSCLRAFYRKGGLLLVGYHDPMCIEGLEEETGTGVADFDVSGPMGTPENGNDKRRKQKSVAELMGEDESKIKKTKTGKRKPLVVSVTPESDHEGGGGGFEEETMSPRQRKKSRFLSPPYLSPIGLGSGKLSGSGSFKESKPEPGKVSEMAGEQVEDSLKKNSGKKAREKRRVEEHKKTNGDASMEKVVEGLLRAALDASCCVQKEKNLPTIMEVVLSFRGSIFKEGGSANPTGKKKGSNNQCGKKKEGEEDKDTSELWFIKQKLEWMSEMVHKCEEREMDAEVKASLHGGLQEVLGKVVKMRGK